MLKIWIEWSRAHTIEIGQKFRWFIDAAIIWRSASSTNASVYAPIAIVHQLDDDDGVLVCVCVDVHKTHSSFFTSSFAHSFDWPSHCLWCLGAVCEHQLKIASILARDFFHAKYAQTPNQFSIVGVSTFGSTECRKKLAVLNVAGINESALTVIIITIFVVIKHFIFLFFSSPFCGKNFVMRACYINGFDRWDIYVFSLYNSLLIL